MDIVYVIMGILLCWGLAGYGIIKLIEEITINAEKEKEKK